MPLSLTKSIRLLLEPFQTFFVVLSLSIRVSSSVSRSRCTAWLWFAMPRRVHTLRAAYQCCPPMVLVVMVRASSTPKRCLAILVVISAFSFNFEINKAGPMREPATVDYWNTARVPSGSIQLWCNLGALGNYLLTALNHVGLRPVAGTQRGMPVTQDTHCAQA